MSDRWKEPALLAAVLVFLALIHGWAYRDTEPYFNNDETRHVMTGVFFRDALCDLGWRHPRDYATRYYLQYPALGLLVWPPLFHAIEGAAMLLLGTSVLVGKALVLLFMAMACIYVYRLVRLTHAPHTAALTALLLGLTPLPFMLSRFIMLEVPTLAWSLMAIYHFERYLKDGRRCDAPLACLAAAATALTRFDGVFLLPYFLIRLVAGRRWAVLKKPLVLGSITAALLLTGPYYLLTWRVYGGAIQKQAEEGTRSDFARFDAARNLTFYPGAIPGQVGPVVAIVAVAGLIGWAVARRRPMGMAFALIVAVYMSFSLFAELESRHALYWVPALCWFAAEAIEWLPGWRWRAMAALILVLPISYDTLDNPTSRVHGYAEAARRIVEQPRESQVVFFDGCMSGGFIYQVRRHDPRRTIGVLRGDKLVYGVLSDPAGGYAESAKSADEIVALLHRYDPDWIVLEHPQVKFPDLPGPRRLRQAVRERPDRFEHVAAFDVALRSDHELFQGVTLEFYRPIQRNPRREALREIPMLNLKGPIKVGE